MIKRFTLKANIYYLVTDLLLLTLVFFIIMVYLPATFRIYLPRYDFPFIVFCVIWLVVGIICNKFRELNGQKLSRKIGLILIADLLAVVVACLVIQVFSFVQMSPRVLFGLAGITYLLENLLMILVYTFKKAIRIDIHEDQPIPRISGELTSFGTYDEETQRYIRDSIAGESGEEVLEFLQGKVDLTSSGTLFLLTSETDDLRNVVKDQCNVIINLKRINDVRRINKFIETVNSRLPAGGFYAGCVETMEIRKARVLKEIFFPLNYIYYFFDFLFNRVASKLVLTRRIYIYVTNGYNRIISKAEAFGRMYSCGFEITGERTVDGLLYFTARKITDPLFPRDAAYGSVIALKRIGKDEKRFYVYKLRTMHPYAEYLQDYVYQKNNLLAGGKFNNDFRISTMGRIARKFWIDELPMVVNLLKGDMKLVGVRPISEHYFNLYTRELQLERIKYKPGLFPPFYYDLPKELEEIMASEWKYLNAYKKSPLRTDWTYFWGIIGNILFNGARSR